MLEPCPSHGVVRDSQQSTPMSLIFMLERCFLHQAFSRKLQIFEPKHSKPLREYVNKEWKIFVGLASFDFISPQKWGRWLDIFLLKQMRLLLLEKTHSLSLLGMNPTPIEINGNDFIDSISAVPGPVHYTRTGMVLKIEEEGRSNFFIFSITILCSNQHSLPPCQNLLLPVLMNITFIFHVRRATKSLLSILPFQISFLSLADIM